MALRTDDIGFGGYRLLQETDAFCYGVDAVLLADFARCGPAEHVCELGSGNGVVPLIINAKYCPAYIAGIEKQPEMVELASRSAALNGLGEKISFFSMDVLEVKTAFRPESFDLVCTNPPYVESGCGPENPQSARHIARHETSASLADFFAAAAYLLKPGGRLAMVHRPQRLADIITLGRKAGLEPKVIRPVVPKEGSESNIVLVRFVKGGGKELHLMPQLVIRNNDGSYTPQLREIYGK